MLITRIAAAVLLVGSLFSAPAIAQDDCSKVPEKDQAECYWGQADDLAGDIVEELAAKCKKIENKEVDQAACTVFGLALLLKEVEGLKIPKR